MFLSIDAYSENCFNFNAIIAYQTVNVTIPWCQRAKAISVPASRAKKRRSIFPPYYCFLLKNNKNIKRTLAGHDNGRNCERIFLLFFIIPLPARDSRNSSSCKCSAIPFQLSGRFLHPVLFLPCQA